ncbi:amidohydrolase domain-containing protein, putative [Eimeria tenella]|uniref:Amidohydrolase domain-containing protein, putative n=1 Tax=Eimeria tenella TaxID=5802 RepID=U6L1I0_EIMTE|nr:amidohydrolase domain-containing protein, putative [Eimeria tenella]CDJ41625.1 amidohydrolase domain-containing protein, putative [Eimeria tenella]|eukprot:XP_013232375.1 amidohydrolase domain-containing protein, putative [Eimeria tenella]
MLHSRRLSRCICILIFLATTAKRAETAAAAAAAAEALTSIPDIPLCGSPPTHACVLQQAAALQDWGTAVRRQLHRHPELMYEELQTSILVQQVLTKLGIKHTTGWGRDRRTSLVDESLLEPSTERGDAEDLQKLQELQQQQQQQQQKEAGVVGTGVVAEIGTGEAPCVLLRADMDALPIVEQADVGFKSEVLGKMHACGHDVHTTMLLMAAAILKKNESSLKGTVRLVFQPAEEGGEGARMMLEEGLLQQQPTASLALGLHVAPQLPTGTIASRAGNLMAATASFHFEVVGVGGHGAMPFETHDPIAACAAAVQNINTFVARENDYSAESSGFVSVTQIQAGSAFNVIPSKCTLKGTIRAFSNEKLRELQLRLRQVVQHTAEAFRCSLRVIRLLTNTPALRVHPEALAVLHEAAPGIVAGGQVITMEPTYGGEDFAFVLDKLPGAFAFIGIGSGAEKAGHVPTAFGLHHPKFAADEAVLQVGAALEAKFAFEAIKHLLQQQKPQGQHMPSQEPQQQKEEL